MTVPDSTVKKPSAKAGSCKRQKPYPGFPLSWHQSGYWCKKIRGKRHYFGARWGDWQQALEDYERVAADLHAGREPRADPDAVTVALMCNSFLTDREARHHAGELSSRSFSDYQQTCKRIVATFGRERVASDLRPDDFAKLRKTYSQNKWAPTTIANEIGRVGVVLNFAYQSQLIDKPIRVGPSFKRPSKKTLRQHRYEKGERLFEAEQLRQLIDEASPELRAMILLGINCGLGNRDCAKLQSKHLDLASGWLNYPRPKTGVKRRAKLWPETVEALKLVIANRKPPKRDAHAKLIFITKYRGAWYSETGSDCPITKEMRKLLGEIKIYRPGLSFYAIRHTFETIAGDSRDQVAVDHVMGHERPDMASVYRERINDARLEDVATFVHDWLFPAEGER